MLCLFRLLLLGSALSASSVSSSALKLLRTRTSSPLNQRAGLGSLDTDGADLQGLTRPVAMGSPDCSAVYGRGLNLASCGNALAKMVPDAAPLTFGERGTGTWDVVLPRRHLSDDGRCAFDIKVDPSGAQRDVSNYLEINAAASALLHTCVETRTPRIGGVVKQLGVNYRSLSVEMSRYVPLVECHDDLESAPPSYNSCKDPIDTMQWSETLTKFGYPWQPGVQVQLPYFLASADGQCKLFLGRRIEARPPLETSTWASVWSGAVAINEMCVKDGKSGHASPASQFGDLKMFLFGQGEDPPPEMLASLNMSTSDLKTLSAFNRTLSGLDTPPPVTNA